MCFKKITVIAFAFLMSLHSAFAQEQEEELRLSAKDSVVASSWMLGVGYNFVDDSGQVFDDLFDIRATWNSVPYPSRISLGRYFKSGIGIEAIAAYTKYKEGKRVDGVLLTEEKDYFAIDTRLSYDLNKLFGQTGFFDPYVGIGLGYTQANDEGRGTYNGVVGFRTWFSDRIGLDFSSSGKWSLNSNTTNHLQHAVGVIYQFDVEKELSKKGKEKLALLQAMEKENARVNDSIVSAKEATALATRLAKEKEQQALAAQEKLKEDEANNKRKAIENSINGLNPVYFDLNSSYLTANASTILSKLAKTLKENPTVVIEISSYTDSRGTDTYNMWLSDKRVNSTVAYLKENGVPAAQIIGKAFGEEVLVNECDDNTYCPEEKHQQNRRSEFKILNY
jgi:outer membrane protein OmpA-like peptidoglycan-associated protein/outer membrane protein W